MNKRLKIALYCILAIAIIAVVYLMFGKSPKFEAGEADENTEILTGENIDNKESIEQPTVESTQTFEDDVMKDLEGFFGDSNGYENVEGEYGFTNPENE